MADLATLERILKERDRIDLYIRFLELGDEKDRELVLAMLKQESKSLKTNRKQSPAVPCPVRRGFSA